MTFGIPAAAPTSPGLSDTHCLNCHQEWSVRTNSFGTIFCVLGIVLCIRTARVRFGKLDEAPPVSLGITRLPAESAAKLAAFVALIVMPAGAIFIANYHTFEGVHEVRGCASCHVMLPMVNDLRDPNSGTLAARHFKNKWIAENQCYHCHSDYGFDGNLEAKMTGYRHLARYTTHTYKEPIAARVRFNNKTLRSFGSAIASIQANRSRTLMSALPCSHQLNAKITRPTTRPSRLLP